MKNYMICLLIGISMIFVQSCANEKPNTGNAVKKETAAKKSQKGKTKQVGKKKGKKNSGTKYWRTAERRLDLTKQELTQLKAARKKFIADKKALRKKGTTKDRDAVIQNYYASVKKILGDEKGEHFINFSRKYQKNQSGDKKD